jgi:hypothetical protein
MQLNCMKKTTLTVLSERPHKTNDPASARRVAAGTEGIRLWYRLHMTIVRL